MTVLNSLLYLRYTKSIYTMANTKKLIPTLLVIAYFTVMFLACSCTKQQPDVKNIPPAPAKAKVITINNVNY